MSKEVRNIVYIIDSLGRGGSQAILKDLTAGLGETGRYEQLVLGLNDEYSDEIVEAMRRHARVRVVGKLALLLGYGLWSVFRACRQADIVVTYLPRSDIVGRLLAWLARTPVIVTTIHARNINKHWWEFFLDRLTMPIARRVIFNSSSVIPFAVEHEGVREERAVYIPNGIRINGAVHESFQREFLRIYPGKLRIGSAGRLVPQKAFPVLLRAFARIAMDRPDLRLYLAGRGPLEQELRALADELGIADRMYFVGSIPMDDIVSFLDLLDVYVQSSDFEGMSVALMQAMDSGSAAVATRVDGTLEVIREDGDCGRLVDPGDVAGLADAMEELCDDPKRRRRIAEAGRARIRDEFSLELMIRRHDELFRELWMRHGRAA